MEENESKSSKGEEETWKLEPPSFAANTLKMGGWDNSGIDRRSIPTGISSAPFIWELQTGEKIPMEFMSGFVGYSQAVNEKEEEDGIKFIVKPEVGWFILHKNESQNEEILVDESSNGWDKWVY